MPVWQIVRLHACLCSRYSLCSRICACAHTSVTDYAKVFTPYVANKNCLQNMPLHAYLWGRLCKCIRACVADAACVVECATACSRLRCRECRACMPVWRILQMHACLCGKYSMCSSICEGMQPRVSLCGGFCDCMHACVADCAVPE